MTSEDDKPLHKQFLRVQREEEEDTWISGEELKTEGSSGSDDDVPRRKISPRKSRRRRSEGYSLAESRLSLPNLADNQTGIGFKVSKPDEKDHKSDRFSVGSEVCAEQERMRIDAAMSRMSTRSSLDKMEEAEDCAGDDCNWRPKRGSLKLPNLEEGKEKRKVLRFSDDIEKIQFSDNLGSRLRFNGYDFENQEEMDEADSMKDYFDDRDNCASFSNFYEDPLEEDDIDRYILKGSDGDNWKPILKTQMRLPDFDGGYADTSVKQFVSDMSTFYNEMSSKLKSLKNCPVIENSQNAVLDSDDEKFMEKENFKNLYKNMKKTPKVKNTLSIISKMDSDISDTINKFREERAERLKVQKQLMNKIPRDRHSQLFLQLCEFETKSSDNLKNGLREKRSKVTDLSKRSRKHDHNKDFIERNIELAKVGMNFSLSDEEKQRLEKILRDEVIDFPDNDETGLPEEIRRANGMLANKEENSNEKFYSVNAYRFSDEHKKRLVGINSALKVYQEDESKQSSKTNLGVGLMRSLEEIDEKLKLLSASFIHDEELLEKSRKKTANMDIVRMSDNVEQTPTSDLPTSTESVD